MKSDHPNFVKTFTGPYNLKGVRGMEVIQWLLSGDPWVAYRTRQDLLHEGLESSEVQAVYDDMVGHPKIQNLLDELSNWPGAALKSHKKAGLCQVTKRVKKNSPR